MKKNIMAIILALVLSSMSFSQVAGTNTSKPAQTLPKDSVVLQKATADVTGDGIKDNIILAGRKFDTSSPYMKNIFLLVNSTLIEFPKETDGGYDPKFLLKDFTGDKIPEIYVSTATGGSGGIMYYHIYSLKGGNSKLLFSPVKNSPLTIEGAFQPNYKVKFTVKQTNKAYSFDFTERKSTYDDPNIKLYKNGKLLKHVDLSIDDYGLVTPVDVDKDGIYELKGIQRIWGVAHVDTLAEVTSTWKLVTGSWKLIKVEVTKIKV
jgi:hypothetical protein